MVDLCTGIIRCLGNVSSHTLHLRLCHCMNASPLLKLYHHWIVDSSKFDLSRQDWMNASVFKEVQKKSHQKAQNFIPA